MSLLSRLFGGGSDAKKEEVAAIEHGDFRIYPEPINEGGRWRVGARIEKDVGGEVRVHRLVRADTLESRETAVEISVNKAKSTLDQLGDHIFDQPSPH